MTSLGSVPDGVHLALDDSDSKFMPPKKTTIEAVAPSHVTVFPNRHFPFPFTAPRMGDLPFSCLPPTAWESSAWEPTGFQCRSPPPQSMASTSRHEYAERWDLQTTRQPPRNRGNPHPAPPPPTQKPLLWPTPPTTDPAPRRPGKLPRLVHPYREPRRRYTYSNKP